MPKSLETININHNEYNSNYNNKMKKKKRKKTNYTLTSIVPKSLETNILGKQAQECIKAKGMVNVKIDKVANM